MANYKIFEHSQLSRKAVRQGFAWEVFISESYLGALQKKIHLILGVVIAALVIYVFAVLYGLKWLEYTIDVMGLGFFLYCGLSMSRWYEALLMEQGYQCTRIVNADSNAAALMKKTSDN